MATVSPRPETVVCNLLKGLDDPPEAENIVVRQIAARHRLSHGSPQERRIARLSDYPAVPVDGTQPLCGHYDVGETCIHFPQPPLCSQAIAPGQLLKLILSTTTTCLSPRTKESCCHRHKGHRTGLGRLYLAPKSDPLTS